MISNYFTILRKLKHSIGDTANKYLKANKFNSLIWSIIRGIIVLGICFIIAYPVLTKISIALMAESDLYNSTVRYVPKNFTIDNFKTAWQYMEYNEAFTNSFLLSMITSTLQVVSSIFIAYGFSRFEFKGKNIFFGLVMLTLVVPPQTIMLPLYFHFRFFDIFGILSKVTGSGGINLLDSFIPFALLSITGTGLKNGLYIFMARQYFKGIPKELEEAAYIDGAGAIKTFIKIMIPGSIPIIMTIFLFSFVWQWNDSFYATLFLPGMRTLPGTLSALPFRILTLSQTYNAPYASQITNTGSLLVIAPLLVIYVALQKYFVESIERSGLVG